MASKLELQQEVKRLNKRVEDLEFKYKAANDVLMKILEKVTPFIPVFNKALELEIEKTLEGE